MKWFKLLHDLNIEIFHLFSCPGSGTQKFQAGFYTRIIIEAFNIDFESQLLPAVKINELGENRFEGFAMKGVVFLQHNYSR